MLAPDCSIHSNPYAPNPTTSLRPRLRVLPPLHPVVQLEVPPVLALLHPDAVHHHLLIPRLQLYPHRPQHFKYPRQRQYSTPLLIKLLKLLQDLNPRLRLQVLFHHLAHLFKALEIHLPRLALQVTLLVKQRFCRSLRLQKLDLLLQSRVLDLQRVRLLQLRLQVHHRRIRVVNLTTTRCNRSLEFLILLLQVSHFGA